jgi:hypothetical protein
MVSNEDDGTHHLYPSKTKRYPNLNIPLRENSSLATRSVVSFKGIL